VRVEAARQMCRQLCVRLQMARQGGQRRLLVLGHVGPECVVVRHGVGRVPAGAWSECRLQAGAACRGRQAQVAVKEVPVSMLVSLLVSLWLTGVSVSVGRVDRGVFGCGMQRGAQENNTRAASEVRPELLQATSERAWRRGTNEGKRYTGLMAAFEVGREEVFTKQRCGCRDAVPRRSSEVAALGPCRGKGQK
jgi:hypothetical protein